MFEGAPPKRGVESQLLSRVALGIMCGVAALVVLVVSLRDTRPEPLRVSVAGAADVLGAVDTDGSVVFEPETDRQVAHQRLEDGDVTALLEIDGEDAELIVSEPPSVGAADRVEDALRPALAEVGLNFDVQRRGDLGDDALGGRSPILVSVALALGGTLAAAALHSRRLSPLQRLAGAVAVVVILGAAAAVALVPTGLFDDVAIGVALLGALAAGASAAIAAALFSAFGRSVGLAISLSAICVSTAITGGTVPTVDLPPMWRALEAALPVGAGRDALVSLTWFSAAATIGPVTILLVYTFVGLGVVLLAGRLRRPATDDAEAPGPADRPLESGEPVDLPPSGPPPRRTSVERDGPAPQPEPGRIATSGPFLFGTRNGGEPLPRRVQNREPVEIVRRNGHADTDDPTA
jgi:hypothetical protein